MQKKAAGKTITLKADGSVELAGSKIAADKLADAVSADKPPALFVLFEDVNKNTWGQLIPILEAAARKEIVHLRFADVPVEVPDERKLYDPKRVEPAYPDFLPMQIAEDADLEKLKDRAARLARLKVVLRCQTRTPVPRLLAVIRLLNAADVTVYFAAWPLNPNEKTGLAIEANRPDEEQPVIEELPVSGIEKLTPPDIKEEPLPPDIKDLPEQP